MVELNRRDLIGIAWIGLGLFQAVWGLMQSDQGYVVLGIAYSLLGVVYLWYEGSVVGQ